MQKNNFIIPLLHAPKKFIELNKLVQSQFDLMEDNMRTFGPKHHVVKPKEHKK